MAERASKKRKPDDSGIGQSLDDSQISAESQTRYQINRQSSQGSSTLYRNFHFILKLKKIS